MLNPPNLASQSNPLSPPSPSHPPNPSFKDSLKKHVVYENVKQEKASN